MGYRIQGAGCRMQVQGELVMPKVYVEWQEKHDCALPAQYTKHSNERGHSLELGPGAQNITCVWLQGCLRGGASEIGSELGTQGLFTQ